MIERSWCRRPVHVQPWAWKANMEIRKTQVFQASHWLRSCEPRDSDWLIDGWCSRWLALYPPLLCGHLLHCGHLCDPGLLRLLWSDQVVILKGEPQNKKMWEKWESFLLRGSSRLKLLSDQEKWFSQNMGFGKDIMTKNCKCWKQSEGVVKWENISFTMFFLLWESPTSHQNNFPCEKNTWPYVKVVQFVSGDIIKIGF